MCSLSDINKETPIFFGLLFTCYIFSHTVICILCPYVLDVSHKEPIIMFHFYVLPDNICLLEYSIHLYLMELLAYLGINLPSH